MTMIERRRAPSWAAKLALAAMSAILLMSGAASSFSLASDDVFVSTRSSRRRNNAVATTVAIDRGPRPPAFVSPPSWTMTGASVTRMVGGDGGQDGEAFDAASGGELTSALARLDRKWQLAQRDPRRRSTPGGWTKLVISDGGASSSYPYETDEISEIPFISPPSGEDFVYLLEPPSGATPSCVLLFLGGAALGQFPHIAYSEFLTRVATRLNAAVVAAPYAVGLDHFDIAKRSGELLRKALIQCEDKRGYPTSTPKFALGHSLGAKLHTISIAATGIGRDLDGVGYISYNNFGFASTIGMAKVFAKELRAEDRSMEGTFGAAGEAFNLDALLDLAEMAVGAAGLEFSPGPTDTDRIVAMKFDEDLQRKTRLFVFDNDELDSSKGFVDSCRRAGINGENGVLTLSGLPGTHLTPVYLEFGLEDLPEETRDLAGQVTGGISGASFGSEENLNLLVSEVSSWVLGKAPSREPGGANREVWEGRRRISGGVVDAEIES